MREWQTKRVGKSSRAPIKTIAGWSEHAWRSLAVKSWRTGWIVGWDIASRVLTPATLRGIAAVQIFEDTAPTPEGADAIADAILRHDWEFCLSRDTHHGKGYTDEYCRAAVRYSLPIEPHASEQARQMKDWSVRLGINLPPRAWFWWHSWETVMLPADQLRDETRELCTLDFLGMPDCVLDRHTPEGKNIARLEGTTQPRSTIWCGDPEGHRALAEAIEQGGWEKGRSPAHVLAQKAIERQADYARQFPPERQQDLW